LINSPSGGAEHADKEFDCRSGPRLSFNEVETPKLVFGYWSFDSGTGAIGAPTDEFGVTQAHLLNKSTVF